jgi:formyltetrahydrofolate hydrolase
MYTEYINDAYVIILLLMVITKIRFIISEYNECMINHLCIKQSNACVNIHHSLLNQQFYSVPMLFHL